MTAGAGQMKIRAITYLALEHSFRRLQYLLPKNFLGASRMRSCGFLRAAAAFAAATVLLTAGFCDDAATWGRAHQSELVELYKHFHTHPQLSFGEYETGAPGGEKRRAGGVDGCGGGWEDGG